MTASPDPGLPTASWGRRILALLVDWLVCSLVVAVFEGGFRETGAGASPWVLPTYVLQTAVFTWLLGGSFGKLVTRLRVVPEDEVLRPLNPLKVLARQVLIVLVIPPLVFRADGRGLHDLLSGTKTVTLQTYLGLVTSRTR